MASVSGPGLAAVEETGKDLVRYTAIFVERDRSFSFQTLHLKRPKEELAFA